GLHFNLSNTFGLVVNLTAHERDAGVDVEDLERRGQTVAIADRFFSPAEVAALRAAPASMQRARFFDYWTLKEAYIKARRMGLATPLRHFSFSLPSSPGLPIAIAFDPALEDDAAEWQFAQFRPTERHLVSIAIRRGSGPDHGLAIANTLPPY